MFNFFSGMSDPLNAQYKTIIPLDEWYRFLGVQMWLIFDDKAREQDERFYGDKISSWLLQVAPLDCQIM